MHPLNTAKLAGEASPAGGERAVGRLLCDAGKLTAADVERIVRAQKGDAQTGKALRFGEVAIKLGLIGEADLQHALSQQFAYPHVLAGEGQFGSELVAVHDPFGPHAEQLRRLRSQLMLRWFSKGHKALAIAGIHPGDGVSHVAANLAVLFSQLGERTLLIDANLRVPSQHALFGLGAYRGLSELLAGRAGMPAIVRIPAFPNLSVLGAGAVPPNPAELLSNTATPARLEGLIEHYGIVLVDTPPAQDSADAEVVAARTGAVLLVLRQDHTRLAAAAAFKTRLTGVGAALIGTVLNRF